MEISIQSPNFKLPSIHALLGHQQMMTGANKPLLVTGCDLETGEKVEYVVKLMGAERMHPGACLKELLASFIAMEMSIPVAEPGLVWVSEEFMGASLGQPYYQTISNSIGLNFGTKKFEGLWVIPRGAPLSPMQKEDASLILAFDLMIQNPDRRQDKPNSLTDGDRILIFDHELGFSFIEVLFPSNQPWIITENDRHWINSHYLLKKLKRYKLDLNLIESRINRLDSSFWDKARSLVPDEWQSSYFDKIKSHIELIREHRSEFVIEVQKLLV